MRQKSDYYVFLILLMILGTLMIVSCGAQSPPEAATTPTVHPGKALVSSRCIGCHQLNRVTNAAFDREGWQLTVDRMVLSGAQLSEEQVGQVVDYLAQTYPKE